MTLSRRYRRFKRYIAPRLFAGMILYGGAVYLVMMF